MPQDPSAMRAAHADRDRATDVLKAAVAEGRLRPDEYEDRLGAALAAQTYGELNRLVADLPVGPAVGTGQALAPVPPTSPASARTPAPPRSGSNALAVAAFVTSFVGMTGVGAIVAIILGHLAKRQIRETGERGMGLATAAVVLGWVQLALIMLMFVGMAVVDPSGPVPPPEPPVPPVP